MSPQCFHCKHLDETGRGWKCPAFPEDIPDQMILFNKHDHRKPYPGDHGVRFEPSERFLKHLAGLTNPPKF